MSDRDLEFTRLKRKLAAHPDDLQLRARLYHLIIRLGQGSERGLKLAAAFEDPAAKSLVTESFDYPEVLTDDDFRELGRFPLQELDFACYDIKETSYAHFHGMELRALTLKLGADVLGDGLEFLKNMPLRSLSLAGSEKLRDKVFKTISTLPLKSLSLESCDLKNNDSLRWLANMSLESLNLEHLENLNDEDLVHIAQLPLKSLFIQNAYKLTDAAFQHLVDLPLEDLKIENCSGITDKGIQRLSGSSMRSLNLESCSGLSSKTIEHIGNLPLETLKIGRLSLESYMVLHALKQPSLRNLSLSLYHESEPEPDLSFLKGLNLESLELGITGELKDTDLQWLRHLPLKSFSLIHNTLTDNALSGLRGLPLESLDLRGLEGVSNAALSHLGGLPLKELKLSDIESLSDEGLQHLSQLPLESLEINQCGPITAKGLSALPKGTLKFLQFNIHKDAPEADWQALKDLNLEKLDIGYVEGDDLTQPMHQRLEKDFPGWQCWSYAGAEWDFM